MTTLSRPPARRRTAPRLATLAVVLTVTACGQGATAEEGDGGGSGNYDAEAIHAQLEQYGPVDNEFTAPGGPLEGVESLRGKTVFYIPIVGAVPVFHTVGDALDKALGHAGMNVQICDAQANPSAASACFDQAVDQGAAAVVVDSVPLELAPQSVSRVQEAGIPMIVLNQAAPEGSSATVSAVAADQAAIQAVASRWVIDDSKGKANVLVVAITDSDVDVRRAEDGIFAVYEKECPDCVVTPVTVKTLDAQQQLPSLVSAALIKNPDITYLQAMFDVHLPPALQGIQQSGRSDIKVIGTTGALDGVQRVAAGTQTADVGWDPAYLAWITADMTLRKLLGQPVDEAAYGPRLRILTSDNVEGLDITDKSWAAGSWYGNDDYQDELLKLWGLN